MQMRRASVLRDHHPPAAHVNTTQLQHETQEEKSTFATNLLKEVKREMLLVA